MKNEFEEKYVFYRFATADLDEAYYCLHAIKRYRRSFTVMAMIKNAIIAYARTFKNCKGKYGKYHLNIEEVVPENHRDLHDKVLHHRDCIIAHTDIDIRNPKLGKYGIMFKGAGYYYEDYLALVDQMEVLVREVRNVVQKIVTEYESEFKLGNKPINKLRG
jgi:hypothetical protein